MIPIWLASHNAHLGARPIDCLRDDEFERVLAAADAYAAGSYA
jgi:hypothetical protein